MENNPVVVWFGILISIAVAMLAVMLPRTPIAIILEGIILFLSLVLIVWNLPWMARSRARQIGAFLVVFCVCVVVGYIAWPSEEGLARFHVLATDVVFNRRNPNQLIVNIYIENDAGDANIEVQSASGLAPVSKDQQKIIEELRKIKTDAKNQGDGLHFLVPAKEKRWFTVFGPVLSNDHVQEYNNGNLAFFFVASVVIREKHITRVLESCGFVIGNNPGAILMCPSFGGKKS